MVSVPPPSSSCRATFVGDGLKRYDWEVIGDARIEGTGNSVLIVFNGMQEAPSEATSVEAKVTCIATYTDSLGLDKTIRSNQISVQWNVPKVGLDIEGEVEVLRNSSQVYHAKVTPEGETSGKYTWRWTENGLEHVVSGENYTIDFSQTTVAQIILNCEVNIGGMHKSADPITISILDQNYLIKVVRKDYSGSFDTETRKTTHDGPDITDDSLVFVHFNVDDDDESAEENDKRFCGWDYLDNEVKGDTFDDDLCDITIKVFQANGMENVNGKEITIQMPPFLKLWKTNTKGDNLLIGDSQPKKWSLDNQCNNNEILNTKLFVEGVDCDKKGEMIISVGGITRRLEYATCSVGGKDDQPTKEERKKYIKESKDLIDCEWCLIRKSDFNYNCIAFAVDPYLQVFKEVDYDNGQNIRPLMNIDDRFPGSFRVNVVTITEKNHPIPLPSGKKDNFVLCVKIAFRQVQYETVKNEAKIKFGLGNYYLTDIKTDSKYPYAELLWYTPNFKNEIINFLHSVNVDLKYVQFQYFLLTPYFSNCIDDGIDAFFQSNLWAVNNGGKSFEKCTDANDNERKIVFYQKIHAARKASTLRNDEYKVPDNIPSNWEVFASKLGDYGVILHRVEQLIEGYGQITRSYKYGDLK